MKKGEPVTARADKLAWVEALANSTGEGCRDWPWARVTGHKVPA